jgi:hypothetical protein
MKEQHSQILGIVLAVLLAGFIVWLYATEPKTIRDAATKATVTVGTYEVDKAKLAEGVRLFRADNHPAAREFLNAADVEKRDPATQFYIAYSFYRQGFGKMFNDDALFRQGLEALKSTDNNFRSADEDLKLKTPAELRNELEQGLLFTADDLNPLRVLRERK